MSRKKISSAIFLQEKVEKYSNRPGKIIEIFFNALKWVSCLRNKKMTDKLLSCLKINLLFEKNTGKITKCTEKKRRKNC